MTSTDELLRELKAAGSGRGHRRLLMGSALLVLAGASAFLMGILGAQPARAWQAYLINFVFWTGLAFGAVLLSAAMTMTGARWGRPIKRLAEAPGAFLPVAFLLFWGLYVGREKIFPWILEPVHHKEVWLNVPFLFARDGLSLLLLTLLALGLIAASVRGDLRAAKRGKADSLSTDKVAEGSGRLEAILAPAYAIFYALILTLIAFDLIMSLDPHWVSTLFGAYYFVGSFYSGLAAVMVLCVFAVKHLGLGQFVRPSQFHDLGKLMLAFCIVTGDFFYAQFLVIWYGNLPEETRYVITRLRHSPWEPLAWTVLILCFVVPFVVLLNRKIKMKPMAMLVLSGVILLGMWLERLLLVAPSLWKTGSMPIGFTEIFITAGFFGLVALCVLVFLNRFPMLPVSDPLFREAVESAAAESRH